MEIAFAADHTAVKQNVAGPNINILPIFFMFKLRLLSFSRSQLIDF